MHEPATDLNVVENRVLPTPAELVHDVIRSEGQTEFVLRSRAAILDVLRRRRGQFLAIVGPCSIHDVQAGREYAARLAGLAKELSERILVVMRVYFEKPRTTFGWKGLIMDPHLDGSGNIADGLRLARTFLRDVIDLGLPTATELVDPITPQYVADLVCWSAIGARTAESQPHRQMASGLSMPLGFKNGTDGDVQGAVNGVLAARQPQTFLGVSLDGRASAVRTRGNPNCHLVLRGGRHGPNYSPAHVDSAEELLRAAGVEPAIVIDCSHGNSGKDFRRQPLVLREVLDQVRAGRTSIIGVMLESNLEPGSQPFSLSPARLRYGVSITDGCIGWAETEAILRETYEGLAARFR